VSSGSDIPSTHDVISSGDFNGDGISDILLQSAVGGYVVFGSKTPQNVTLSNDAAGFNGGFAIINDGTGLTKRIANDPRYGLKGGVAKCLGFNMHINILVESVLDATANALGYFFGGCAQQAVDNAICESYGTLGYDTRLLGELANRFLQHLTRFLCRDLLIPLIKEKRGYLSQARAPSETRNFCVRLCTYGISIFFDFVGTLLLRPLKGPSDGELSGTLRLPSPAFNGAAGALFGATDFCALVLNRYISSGLGWDWEPTRGTIDRIRFSAVTRVLVIGVDMVAVTGIKNWLPGRFPNNQCQAGVSSDGEVQKIVAVLDGVEASIGMAGAQLSPVGIAVTGGLPGDHISNRATISVPNSISPVPRKKRESIEHRLGESLPSRNLALNSGRPILREGNGRSASQGLVGTNSIRNLGNHHSDAVQTDNFLHIGQSNVQLLPIGQEKSEIESDQVDRAGEIGPGSAENRHDGSPKTYNVSVDSHQDVQSDDPVLLKRNDRVSQVGPRVIHLGKVDSSGFNSPYTGHFRIDGKTSERVDTIGPKNAALKRQDFERIDAIDSRVEEPQDPGAVTFNVGVAQHQDDRAEVHADSGNPSNSGRAHLPEIPFHEIPRLVPRGDRLRRAPDDFEMDLLPVMNNY